MFDDLNDEKIWNCINLITNSRTDKSTSGGWRVCRSMKYSYQKSDLGRLYPEHSSIQNFPRDILFYLFKSSYEDYDIKNCHSTFIYEFAKKHTNLNIPQLSNLVNNRKEFQSEITEQLGQK